MMSNVQTKDYYKALGVPETASADEIKKAYRRLAKKYHPDVTGGDKAKEAKFKEATEAYEVLGDTTRRAEYDAARKSPFGAGPGGMPFEGFPGGGFPFGGGRRRPGAGRAPGGGRVEVHDFSDLFGGGERGRAKAGSFSDLFSSLFGGAAETAEPGVAPGRGMDVKSRLDIDLPTAALGGSVPIVVDGKHLTVKIPPGIDEGQTIRVAGQGQPGPAGAGDLLLDIHLRPHDRFRRKGDDLEVDVHVHVDQAILGGKVEVPTLEKPVLLTVPAGTSSGARLRLRGKGARHRGGGAERRGDLYAVVLIDVPREIPDRARELIEEFARLTRK